MIVTRSADVLVSGVLHTLDFVKIDKNKSCTLFVQLDSQHNGQITFTLVGPTITDVPATGEQCSVGQALL